MFFEVSFAAVLPQRFMFAQFIHSPTKTFLRMFKNKEITTYGSNQKKQALFSKKHWLLSDSTGVY